MLFAGKNVSKPKNNNDLWYARNWSSSHGTVYFESIAIILIYWYMIIWIKVANFKLGKEMCKVKWSTGQESRAKEKMSPWKESNPWLPEHQGGCSIHWAMRTHREQGHLTEFICDMHPAYC